MYELTRKKLERIGSSSGRRSASLRELVLLSNFFGNTQPTPPLIEPPPIEELPVTRNLTDEEIWFENVFLEMAEDDYISVSTRTDTDANEEEEYSGGNEEIDSGFLESVSSNKGKEREVDIDYEIHEPIESTDSPIHSSPINLPKFPNWISPFESPPAQSSSYSPSSPSSASPPLYPPALTPDNSPPTIETIHSIPPSNPYSPTALILSPSPYALVSYNPPRAYQPPRATRATTRSLSVDRNFYDRVDWGVATSFDSNSERGRRRDGMRGEGEEEENSLAVVLVSREFQVGIYGNRSRSLSPHTT